MLVDKFTVKEDKATGVKFCEVDNCSSKPATPESRSEADDQVKDTVVVE